MNNNEELLRKWQLKKIATLAFINDECDDMKPKDRKAFYSMMEAIFGEIVADLKNLPLAAVIGSLPSDKLYCEGDLFAAYLTGQQDVRDRSDGLDGRTFTAWLTENFPRQ